MERDPKYLSPIPKTHLMTTSTTIYHEGWTVGGEETLFHWVHVYNSQHNSLFSLLYVIFYLILFIVQQNKVIDNKLHLSGFFSSLPNYVISKIWNFFSKKFAILKIKNTLKNQKNCSFFGSTKFVRKETSIAIFQPPSWLSRPTNVLKLIICMRLLAYKWPSCHYLYSSHLQTTFLCLPSTNHLLCPYLNLVPRSWAHLTRVGFRISLY